MPNFPDICPTFQIYAQLYEYMPNFPDICPTLRIYAQLFRYMPNFPDICPTFQIYAQLPIYLPTPLIHSTTPFTKSLSIPNTNHPKITS
jgi:hypothetical protein